MIGSGVGIVVLKRLADALADGDTIHAVIKGSAINNDGSAKVGYTAPSVEGQAEVILAAQAIAGCIADTISYVEAHGTGTTMGDPIEIAALTQAFRESTERARILWHRFGQDQCGSSGCSGRRCGPDQNRHGAGASTLPPSLNFEQPNPQIDFSTSPFYVNAAARIGLMVPRRAVRG